MWKLMLQSELVSIFSYDSNIEMGARARKVSNQRMVKGTAKIQITSKMLVKMMTGTTVEMTVQRSYVTKVKTKTRIQVTSG